MDNFNVSDPKERLNLYKNLIHRDMKTPTKRKEVKGDTYITKLKIDARTVITVRTKESLKNWKAKYPAAIEVA